MSNLTIDKKAEPISQDDSVLAADPTRLTTAEFDINVNHQKKRPVKIDIDADYYFKLYKTVNRKKTDEKKVDKIPVEIRLKLSPDGGCFGDKSSIFFLNKVRELLTTSMQEAQDESSLAPRDVLLNIIQRATYAIAMIDSAREDFVDLRPAQERILENLAVKAAVDKLLSLKGHIPYQTAKGRAAISARDWLRINLVESGRLTATELRLIPLNTFREFDIRLYQALANADRYAAK